MARAKGSQPRDEGKYQAKYTMAVTVMITGIPAHRIRRFEVFGLCQPLRTQSKQRLFSDRDVEAIRQIARLEGDGINLNGIRVILAMKNGGLHPDE